MAQELDSSDWAKQLLAAQKYPSGTKLPGTSQARLHLARIHAQRGAIAARDAEEAARQAVSLSQHAAKWLRPHEHGNSWIRRGRDDLAASLATVAVESQDATAAHRAIAAARGAREAAQRARALAAAVPKDASTSHKGPEEVQTTQSTSMKVATTSSAPVALPTKEADMYKGERMAAQTAGLCILTICIVLVWFQSNAVDPSNHRQKNGGDEVSILNRFGMLCCCCRQIRCCAFCCVQFVKLLSHCSCSTLSVMGLIVFLMGYSFKQLWDQHLIQPHLEEATIYLFFATIAFIIILILVGSFVNWLRERVGFVHSVVEFVDEKMDVFAAFFGLDDSDDSDSGIWSDVHAYKPGRQRMHKANRGDLRDPAKEALRGRPKGSLWWGPLFGKPKKNRRDVREMPV